MLLKYLSYIPLTEQVIDEDSDIIEAIVAIYGHDENEDEEDV